MRLLHALNALLVLGLIGLSVYVYPELPDAIPRHFDVDGMPDRWGDRTLLSWLLLPLVGAATTALVYVIGILAPNRPRMINMPDKKKLLELPPELQRWVLRGLSNALFTTAFIMLVIFCMLQYGTWQTAMGGSGRNLVLGGLLVGLLIMPFVAVSMLLVVQRRLDRAWWEYQVKGTAGVGSSLAT